MPLSEQELQELDQHLNQEDKSKIDISTLSFMKPVVEKGLVIKTADQHEKEIKKTQGEVFTTVENRYSEITGVKKKDGEKWIDFFTRSHGEITGNLTQKIAELEAAVKSNKEGGKGSATDEEVNKLRTQVKGLQDALESTKGDLTKKESEYTQNLHQFKLSAVLDKAILSAKSEYNKELSESLLGDIIASRREKFLKENKIEFDENGNAVFKDEHGLVRKDTQTGLPLTPEQVWRKEYATDLIVAKKDNKGGIGKKPGEGGPTGEKVNGDPEKYVISESVKTQADLSEDLMKNGFIRGTSAFIQTFNKYSKDLPLGLR